MSDIHLNYIERGQGKPLILLHGNGETHAIFEQQIAYFSKDYRVIALDTRGHGLSPRGDKPFTINQFSDDLYGFMNEKGITKPILLGFSDGGNIALTFALKHPERVEKLILNGANLFPQGVKPIYQWPIVIGYHLVKCFSNKSPEAKKKAELLGLMVNEPHIDPAQLSVLSMPVLVIAGTKDMIKQKHTQLIYKSLPNATLEIINGNHFIANQNPTAFNTAVNNFLCS